MPHKSAATLVEEMKNLFARELQWLMTIKHELKPLITMIDAPDHTELIQLMERYRIESGFFVEENTALRKEWDNADAIPAQDRAEVEALSANVKQAASQLAEVYSLAAQITQKRADSLGKNLTLLQKGKENTHRYRLDDIPDSPYIDRKI